MYYYRAIAWLKLSNFIMVILLITILICLSIYTYKDFFTNVMSIEPFYQGYAIRTELAINQSYTGKIDSTISYDSFYFWPHPKLTEEVTIDKNGNIQFRIDDDYKGMLAANLRSKRMTLNQNKNSQKGFVWHAWLCPDYPLPFPYISVMGDMHDAIESKYTYYVCKGNFVKQVEIVDGAFHVTLGNKVNQTLQDKVVSVRPIIMPNSPSSPFSWICGNSPEPGDMKALGENKTTVLQTELPAVCRF